MSDKMHTPGPWDNYDGVIGTYIEGRHSWTPVAMAVEDPDNIEECIPNGHLIAAAPELLDALKAAVLIIGHPDDAVSRHFRTVIAKASGAAGIEVMEVE